MGLGTWEWGVILLIVLIFFGAGKLPDVFRQAGKGIKAFKDASTGKDEEDEASDDESTERRKARRKELAAKDDLDDDPEESKEKSARKKNEG